jgi:hypothetical protein
MASNINTTDIDAEYPVAGQDNDSQGFRDNFSTIKENFVASKSEIETLQSDTAKLNADNDFSGNTITHANLIANTEEVYNAGNLTSGQNISFDNGHYQTLTVANDMTLTLADWPATGLLGKIRVVILGDGTERTITWSTEAAGTIRYDSNFPSPFTITSSTTPKIVDFWTDDGGVVVYAQYVGEFSA